MLACLSICLHTLLNKHIKGKWVILSKYKMDCKPELSATLSKKSTDYLFQFQINTYVAHKKLKRF